MLENAVLLRKTAALLAENSSLKITLEEIAALIAADFQGCRISYASGQSVAAGRVHPSSLSQVDFPLRAGGKDFGTLSVFSSSFLEEHESFRELALRIALRVQNEQLLESAASAQQELDRMSQALEKSELRFRTLFEQSPVSTQVFAPDGRTLAVNRAWRKIFNVSEEVVRGYVYPHYNVLQDEELEKQGIASLIREGFAGKTLDIPAVAYRPPEASGMRDQMRWIGAMISPIKDDTGAIKEILLIHHDLTEVKRAEEELRHSRDQLNVVLGGVTDGITVLDTQGNFIFANETGAQMCGFPSAEAFLQATTAEIMDRFEILAEDGTPFPINKLPGRLALQGVASPPETLVCFRSREKRELRWSIINAKPVFDEAGKVKFAISIFRDFTERKRAELLLEERELRFRTLAEAMPQLVWIATPEGQTEYCNRQCLLYTGSTIDEKKGMGWENFVHPGDFAAMGAQWKKSMQTGAPFAAEYRLRRHDGIYHWHLGRAVPVRLPDGKIQSWIGTATDIHEQKLVQETSQFLAEASMTLVSSLDFETTLVTVTQLAVPQFADWCSVDLLDEKGYVRRLSTAHLDAEKVAFAEKFYEKYPPDFQSEHGIGAILRKGESQIYPLITDEMMRAAIQEPQHLADTLQLGVRSFLGVPIIVSGKILGALSFGQTDESGRRFQQVDLQLAEELGRRASIAIENALLYQQAQNAIRLRDEFLSIASHELRTPLTSLQMQLQLVARHLMKPAEMLGKENFQGKISMALRQTLRLGTLLDRLLDLSRLVNGKLRLEPEEVDFNSLVQEVLGRFKEEAELVGCVLHLQEEAQVRGQWDKIRIEQAITNLLSNALKYGRGHPVTATLSQTEGFALLRVQDQGIGISPENQKRIFDRFERVSTHHNISGLGIGLYVTREIVEAHKGRISVESELNKGSIFLLELPL